MNSWIKFNKDTMIFFLRPFFIDQNNIEQARYPYNPS